MSTVGFCFWVARSLHKIEADLDALGGNLSIAFNCINLLRSQVVEVLNEISSLLTPAKGAKDSKDNKEAKDTKDVKDIKDTKDVKDVKDTKDTKEAKDAKDGKESKDHKDAKESKDHKDTKDGKDMGNRESPKNLSPQLSPVASMLDFIFDSPPTSSEVEKGRAFIRPSERPEVGARALSDAEG